MSETAKIREQLVKHVKGGEAFMPLEEMLKEVTFEKLGMRPGNLPYSFYELFYHIRFAQKDILEYCTEEDYSSYNWPDDYWPKNQSPQSKNEWEELQQSYLKERTAFCDFVLDEKNELMKPVRPNTDNSLFREVLLVLEHTSYHTGQLLIVLRELGLHSS